MKSEIKTCVGVSALLVAMLAGTALATGPDVIVGDLPDVSNYTTTGAIDPDGAGPALPQRAYAVGTTSCNLGDAPLTWIDCTSGSNCNMHPVISQNMYRINNERIEQLGQAWLKHGFCALQGTVCSSCTPGGNCDALFPGCSDPYSSGLNGSQGGLGPKSEVNVVTGVFPYPWINNGTSDNATLFKRLRVNDADIALSGYVYTVSSMYVQPEDAQNHNNNNNESYRRITFSAAPARDLQLQGTTYRTSPGIFGWRDHGLGAGAADPDVYLSPVDVSGDGRFWVGAKAKDLGAGQYRYVFAVQNLNSDRAAQSFSIPIPSGAVVSNVTFHGVPYHSGEPYSNTDWTSSVTSSSVTWSGPTYATNANGNALRWDTLYTFSFDCNVPPAGGTATLTMFKPGTPTSVPAATVIPSPDGQFHPFNDTCATARSVGAGATSFNSTNATTDGPTECTQNGSANILNDIWYSHTATCTGTYTIDTCGSSFDTKIAVYGATCPSSGGTAIACNDDGACAPGSSVSFSATQGSTYLIRIGSRTGATGSGTLTITAPTCGPQPPANDNCANATWLADATSVPANIIDGTTVLATNDGTGSCGNSASSADVWYKYVPQTSGTLTATTCNSTGATFDTVINAFTGTCGALTEVACNDDNCSLRSTITWAGTAGTAYYIRVAGYGGATGTFKVNVNGGGGVIPPANDNCSGMTEVALGSNPFTTVGATTDGPTPSGCGTGNIDKDVWFRYASLCDGDLTISTCGTASFDTKLAVYSSVGCTNLAGRFITCSDNDCGSQSTITIPVATGQSYTIRVGGANGAQGTGQLVLTCTPAGCSVTCDYNQDGGADFSDVLELADAIASGTDPYPGSCKDYNQDGGEDTGDVIDIANAIASSTCP